MSFIEFMALFIQACPLMWAGFAGAVAFCFYMAWKEGHEND